MSSSSGSQATQASQGMRTHTKQGSWEWGFIARKVTQRGYPRHKTHKPNRIKGVSWLVQHCDKLEVVVVSLVIDEQKVSQ